MKEVVCDKVPKSSNPLSQGIRYGDFIFLSGQLGKDPETGKLKAGFEGQARQVLENLRLLLESEGVSMKQAIKVTVYIKDIHNTPLLNSIYKEYFGQPHFPARSCVEVSALAGGAEVEIELIAAAK